MKHEEQNFLSVGEAADFLKVRTATLYAWVHRRMIPFRKHGARLAFSRAELVHWSDCRKVVPLTIGVPRS